MRRTRGFYLWRASEENSLRKVILEGETSVECFAIIIRLEDILEIESKGICTIYETKFYC